MKCIYCLEEKPASEYKKREHVIPQLFGKFTPNNLILLKTVCDECNSYFGKNIELHLGRDTYEGVLRYRHGIRPRKLPKKHSRLKVKILEGPLKGMLVRPKYSEMSGEIDIDPEPISQVAFFNKERQEYVYFEPQDIPTADELEKAGYDLKKKKLIITKDENETNYLIDLLKSKGIKIEPLDKTKATEYKITQGDKIPVEIDAKIDRIIHRGFSKIAFNYLAYITRSDFVLKDDFSNIRNFIRYDQGMSKDFIIPNVPPILHDDRRLNIKTTEGHLITVGWRGLELFSNLSIFNETTYQIILCRTFKGIWRPLKSGHHFDVNSKNVTKLISGNINLMP